MAWTFDTLARIISTLGGKPVQLQNVSSAEHSAAIEAVGLPRETAQFVASLDSSIAKGELDGASGEHSRLIGRPTTPLEDTLRQALHAQSRS